MKNTSAGVIRIGTSGIVLPGVKNTFPDEFRQSSRLHYYASLFDTLEVNSSFYKTPLAKTFAKWAEDVGEDFKFTVKCWRGITHAKQLDFLVSDIDMFMAAANQLQNKSGCILIQFPASVRFVHIKKVEQILEHINQHIDNQQFRLAIELRHASWYCDAAYKMFEKHYTSVVLHDMPGSATPDDCPINNLVYRRFHGPTGNYDGSYSDEIIHECAEQINKLIKHGKQIYVYFNNTIGAALANAQLLQALTKAG
ncbi:MAG TPA: DUF72 domain-containing protein [Cellvibrionaceae bacterium]